jgi:hypothetical protein
MKTEPKPFASLSSGLLARKGAARPAMRPQGFGGQVGSSGLEDLGWNDMGFEPPKPAEADRDLEHDAFGEELSPHPLRNPLAALTPVNSPVHDQQAEITDRLNVADDAEDIDEDYDETAELVDGDELPASVLAAANELDPEPVAPVAVPMVKVAALPVVKVAPVEVAPVAVAPVARPVRQPKTRSLPGSSGKAAFTLRLDPSRHLKLRLACAVNGRSAQQLVTDAVDRLLADMPELDSMAERAPAKRA